jgi:hypothetical protein
MLVECYFKPYKSFLKCKGKGVIKNNKKENKFFELAKFGFFSLSSDPSYFQTS